MNTDLSEKLQKTIENTELVANEVHATCEAVSKNNDTNLKINSNMSTISENLRKHVRSVSIMNENVSKPDVRKPRIETSNRFEPLSFLNDENQNESQYVEQKQNDETTSKKVMIIGISHIRYIRTNKVV